MLKRSWITRAPTLKVSGKLLEQFFLQRQFFFLNMGSYGLMLFTLRGAARILALVGVSREKPCNMSKSGAISKNFVALDSAIIELSFGYFGFLLTLTRGLKESLKN